MFKKVEENGPQKEVDTLVGPNTTLKGNLESEGSVRIDGFIKGDVNVTGDVILGKDGEVTGNVSAANVYLSGTINGNVNTAGMLKLFSTARLYGDVQISTFVSDEGGIFHGKCNMLKTGEIEVEPVKPPKKSGTKNEFHKSSLLPDSTEEKGA